MFRCLIILQLLVFLPGCFVVNVSLADTTRVRKAGYVGKHFATAEPLRLVRAGIFKRLLPISQPPLTDTPEIATLPAGTRLHITDLRYLNVAMVAESFITYAHLDSGKFAGSEIDISDLVDGEGLCTACNRLDMGNPVTAANGTVGHTPSRWVTERWLLPWREAAMPWAAAASADRFAILVRSLRDPDWVVRFYALRTLGTLTDRREAAAAAAVGAIDDDDPDIIGESLAALVELQPQTCSTIDPLVAAIVQQKPSPYYAVDKFDQALEKLGPSGALSVGHALTTLPPDDDRHFERLVKILARIGPSARPALPELMAAIRVRAGRKSAHLASIPLERIDAAAAQEAMIPDFSDPNPQVRALFAELAGRLAQGGSAAMPAVIHQLQDSDLSARRAAAAALFYFAAYSSDRDLMIPQLLESACDSDPQIRASVFSAMGVPAQRWAVPAGLKFVEALSKGLSDSESAPRLQAVEALARIKFPGTQSPVGKAAYEALIPATRHPDPAIRAAAVAQIAMFMSMPEPARKPAYDLVFIALDDPDPSVRAAAILAIRSAPFFAVPVLPTLKARLNDPDPAVRKAAAEVIPLVHQ